MNLSVTEHLALGSGTKVVLGVGIVACSAATMKSWSKDINELTPDRMVSVAQLDYPKDNFIAIGRFARNIRLQVQATRANVAVGHEVTREASKAFSELALQVQKINDQLATIWETTCAQTSGINILTETIGDLSENAQANATMVVQTAEIAGRLADHGSRLQTVIEVFQLPEEGEVHARANSRPVAHEESACLYGA